MARVSATTDLSYRGGIAPKQQEYDLAMSKMVSNDDVKVIVERANITPAPTAAVWSYSVPFHLETTAGELIPFNGTIGAAVATTSSAGTPAVDSATPAVVNGVGVSVVSGDAAAWLNTETVTLTLTHTNLRGGTDTDTWVVTFTT
jgi:hypothetical protein